MGDDINSESTSTIGDDWWVRLLGVQNRPNPLEDWDQLYNLNNQDPGEINTFCLTRNDREISTLQIS
ncbi:hypothetical protein ANCDUO_02695 [Ancylostoma duodenale]|uniref:Uncharacterized protein n=1 Tax=Ancylostoma duodenale TaxID=51022 RepID=A0A0C2DVT0_9BILA|nr:hypothetical protein ANCDUO_02695 [Ancylostoma duodenale]